MRFTQVAVATLGVSFLALCGCGPDDETKAKLVEAQEAVTGLQQELGEVRLAFDRLTIEIGEFSSGADWRSVVDSLEDAALEVEISLSDAESRADEVEAALE